MANEFVQTMSDARVDARSLSDFVFKPAGFKVPRRLAPPIDTLQFYIDRFDATKAMSDAYVATIPSIVNDAINNTAVEGGVLADTFVTVTANGVGAIARTQRDKNRDSITIKDFGAIGDGVLHRVQEWIVAGATHYRGYANLAAVQAIYPHVTSLDDSIDWVATQMTLDTKAANGGGIVVVNDGHYIFTPVNDSAALKIPNRVTISGNKDGTIFQLNTDVADLPNETVYWDFLQLSGLENIGGGVKDITFRHIGGRRNNCATIAVRGGASRKKITGNIFENAIGSSIAIESSVANPTVTKCQVWGNDISKTGRHGVYVIGATHNTVRDNIFDDTGLEAVVVRGVGDNDILDNDFFQDVSSAHAIALAAPPTGTSYTYKRLKVKGNRIFNYKGSGFYGQGVGCKLQDSDITNNTVQMSSAEDVVSHGMMFYRTTNSKISSNNVSGGKQRGMIFYGCSDNDISKNTIREVNNGGSSVGAMFFAAYTDIDGETFSKDNKVIGNTIVDARDVKKHVYGIQFLTGCNGNILQSNNISGQTSSSILSADGLSAQKVGTNAEKLSWFTLTALPTNQVNNSAQIPSIGNSYQIPITTDAYIKSLTLTTRQTVTTGKITAKIYVNAAFIASVELTGDNTKRVGFIELPPDSKAVKSGDLVSCFIESTTIASSQSSIDCVVDLVTAM